MYNLHSTHVSELTARSFQIVSPKVSLKPGRWSMSPAPSSILMYKLTVQKQYSDEYNLNISI